MKIAQGKGKKGLNLEIDKHLKKYGYIGFRDGVGKFWLGQDVLEWM